METPAEQFQRLIGALETEPNTPQRRRCAGITRKGERCTAWALTDNELCAGHAGIGLEAARSARAEAAEARREARMSVRERAALALDDDWPDVLAALRRGLKDPDSRKASQTAVSYVQLVYGRQLQQKEDEQFTGSDPLDIASMTREQRDKLTRKLIAQHPHLVDELGLDN